MGCSKAEERARETCCVLFFSFCFDTRVFFVFLLTPCTAFFRNNNNNNKREKEAPLDPIIDAQMYSDLMNRKGGGKKVIFFWFVFFVVFFFDRFNRASLEKKQKQKRMDSTTCARRKAHGSLVSYPCHVFVIIVS